MAAGGHPDLFRVDPRFGVKSRHSSEQVRMGALGPGGHPDLFCCERKQVRMPTSGPGGHQDLFPFSHAEIRTCWPQKMSRLT